MGFGLRRSVRLAGMPRTMEFATTASASLREIMARMDHAFAYPSLRYLIASERRDVELTDPITQRMNDDLNK